MIHHSAGTAPVWYPLNNQNCKPMNTDKLKQLARDLRKTPPHSPRDTLGGFVIAARMIDKARADLLSINGEYHQTNAIQQ